MMERITKQFISQWVDNTRFFVFLGMEVIWNVHHMSMDIFDYELTSEAPKLPTFRQWCKQMEGKKRIPFLNRVTKLWLPNKFKNITLETERFRFQIYEDSPVYAVFLQRVEVFCESNVCLAVRVLSVTDKTAKLDQLENETAHWDALGTSGYSLSVMPKK